jgi:hypothetical protein
LSNQMARTPVRLALPLLFIMMVAPAQAQDPAASGQQREHVVRRGDTLWDLARAYLQNPFLWPLIFEANRNVVEDPHWIYPSERLLIPPVLQQQPAGQPVGEPVEPLMRIDVAQAAQEPEADTVPTVIEVVEVQRPIVPLADHMRAPWLSEGGLPARGRIARLADPAAGSQRLPSMVHPNDRVHVAGSAGQAGDSLLVVRFGREVGEWGTVVEPLGILRVERVVDGVATAQMVRQFGEVRVGDLVMALPPLPQIGVGEPEPVAAGPMAHLLEFLNEEPLHGTTDLAFISAGRTAGTGIGDEFAVYVPASAVENGPGVMTEPTQVATVRVVKVGERTSTVRVLSVNSLALENGLPIRLVRKMP